MIEPIAPPIAPTTMRTINSCGELNGTYVANCAENAATCPLNRLRIHKIIAPLHP